MIVVASLKLIYPLVFTNVIIQVAKLGGKWGEKNEVLSSVTDFENTL